MPTAAAKTDWPTGLQAQVNQDGLFLCRYDNHLTVGTSKLCTLTSRHYIQLALQMFLY